MKPGVNWGESCRHLCLTRAKSQAPSKQQVSKADAVFLQCDRMKQAHV